MVRPRGIRVRVTAVAVVITAAVLVVGGITVVVVQHRVLDDALDRSLGERADVRLVERVQAPRRSGKRGHRRGAGSDAITTA